MSMVDFSRGELSPTMRYRKDLEVYHKGVEILERFLPTARGGLVRGPGCQVLELLPPSDVAPAVRMFTLGSTGLPNDILPPGESDSIEIGGETYDTEFRVHNIKKNQEIEILLSFTEFGSADDIVAYWVNTPDKIPAFYQRIWNYESSAFKYPAIDFEDTRDVRVAQVENNVYVIARAQIYRIFWNKDKVVPSWNSSDTYNQREVISHLVEGTIYFFECIETTTNKDPSTPGASVFWRVVYPPYIDWEIISPRVGYEFLKGIGEDTDLYEWVANAQWASTTKYYKGDVVIDNSIAYECIEEHTTGDVSGKTPVEAASAWADKWESYDVSNHPIAKDGEGKDTISDDDKIYRRSSFAFREETVPREMVVHHNRLIFAGSSVRPSTIHGSEVFHYMNFGSGEFDDEPWIVTLSGDKVGKILWMTVTDQLYIGTSGGIFAVSGVLTPNQFQLRKVTSHAASVVHAVAAAGSVIFFHKDGKTLREIEYADQAENYRAFDLTIFSNHLFEEFEAVKMVVVNDPSIIIWILRKDGALISLSYEKTVQMYAFGRHEFQGKVYDIVAGKENELYAIIELEVTRIRQLVRIGDNDIVYGREKLINIKLDGLLSFINTDNTNLFAIQIPNSSMRDWYINNGITNISDMLNRKTVIEASDSGITGSLAGCMLEYFDEIPSIDLSGNSLGGEVPSSLENLMSVAIPDDDGGDPPITIPIKFNIEGNPVTSWEITKIPETWDEVNIKDTLLGPSQFKAILDSIIASESITSRPGTLNMLGLGPLDASNALQKAITLRGSGWEVLIDNEDGWYDEYLMFDGNGHTSGSVPSPISCLFMETKQLPEKGTLLKTGFKFEGWADTATGNPDYPESSNYKKTTQGEKKFFAIWLSAKQVVYSGNNHTGGTVPEDSTLYNPTNVVTIKSGVPVKTGHIFRGWAFNPSGIGEVVQPGGSIVMGDSAIALYAKWEIQSYSLTFSLNGAQKGSVPQSVTQVYGTTYTLPAPPIKIHRQTNGEWMRFRRWNSKPDGTGTYWNVGSTFSIPGSNVTLYAEFISYSVGDDGPSGGIITYDTGSYGSRKFSNISGQTYVWRYVEMWTSNESDPPSGTKRGEQQRTINDVLWVSPLATYLSASLKAGSFPNKGPHPYLSGYYHTVWTWLIVSTKWFEYVTLSGTIDETSDYYFVGKYRLGRGM